MDTKGLTRAVAALRAELHSLNLSGARIVIEVTPAQWHALRVLAEKPHVDQLELVSDAVNGDVVVRVDRGLVSATATAEQLADLGLQVTKKTEANRLEALERQVAALLERSRGFDFERWRKGVDHDRASHLEGVARAGNLATDAIALGAQLGKELRELTGRVADLELVNVDQETRIKKLVEWCKPGEAPAALLEQLDAVRKRLESLERYAKRVSPLIWKDVQP